MAWTRPAQLLHQEPRSLLPALLMRTRQVISSTALRLGLCHVFLIAAGSMKQNISTSCTGLPTFTGMHIKQGLYLEH